MGAVAPTGCTQVFPWEDRSGEPIRCFRGTTAAVVNAFEIYVEGVQTTTTAVRAIVVNDAELTADEARRLASALIAAADEVEAPVNSSGRGSGYPLTAVGDN